MKLFISLMTVSLLLAAPLFADSSGPINSAEEEIRDMNTDLGLTCREIKKEKQDNEKLEKLNGMIAEAREYEDLAKKLEAQGRFDKAEECYKKALSITKSRDVRRYINKKNTKLKYETRNIRRKVAVLLHKREIEKRKLDKRYKKFEKRERRKHTAAGKQAENADVPADKTVNTGETSPEVKTEKGPEKALMDFRSRRHNRTFDTSYLNDLTEKIENARSIKRTADLDYKNRNYDDSLAGYNEIIELLAKHKK